jgi:hypothetical protein
VAWSSPAPTPHNTQLRQHAYNGGGGAPNIEENKGLIGVQVIIGQRGAGGGSGALERFSFRLARSLRPRNSLRIRAA